MRIPFSALEDAAPQRAGAVAVDIEGTLRHQMSAAPLGVSQGLEPPPPPQQQQPQLHGSRHGNADAFLSSSAPASISSRDLNLLLMCDTTPSSRRSSPSRSPVLLSTSTVCPGTGTRPDGARSSHAPPAPQGERGAAPLDTSSLLADSELMTHSAGPGPSLATLSDAGASPSRDRVCPDSSVAAQLHGAPSATSMTSNTNNAASSSSSSSSQCDGPTASSTGRAPDVAALAAAVAPAASGADHLGSPAAGGVDAFPALAFAGVQQRLRTASPTATTTTTTGATPSPPWTSPSTPAEPSSPVHDASATASSGRRSPFRIASWIRARVSQNKIRYRDGDFNLDLTYITPRIVAMGFPAHGTEYYIRNPVDEVERFFDARHAGHYRIYNLCAERVYDSPQRFHGHFRRFPFEDHNAPSLALVLDFVQDAVDYLDADAANVVGVHCKAGKGRTGVMVSCLLLRLHRGHFGTADEAMRLFDQRRTCDGAGITIPSQRRYVRYFAELLAEHGGQLPRLPRRLVLREVLIRVARQSSLLHPGDLYFLVSNHSDVLLDSRVLFPRGPTLTTIGGVFDFASLGANVAAPTTLLGDVKVAVYRRRPIVLAGTESEACRLWFNTTLCPSLNLVFGREELDKIDVAAVGKSILVSLSLSVVDAES